MDRIDAPLQSGRGSGAGKRKIGKAAKAANHLLTTVDARKDRKTALAAAARLFDLAASDPNTRIEFVSEEDGGAVSDAGGGVFE